MDQDLEQKHIESPPGHALPRLLTYREVAARTGLSTGTLYALVSKHQLPHVRLGKRFVRFTEDAVQRWLASRTVAVKGGAR